MRLRLTLAYDGTGFAGFQRQANAPTVQAALEAAVLAVTGTPGRARGAGRTDAGVHAEGQVAVVEVPERPWPCERWVFALNSRLPPSVRVLAAERAEEGFDPQRHAIAKEYRYLLDPNPVQLPWHMPYALHVRGTVDWGRFSEALSLFEGRHDFAAFAAASRSVKTTVRTLYRARLVPAERGLREAVFVGDGFLTHQVRIMVGTALEVARGRRPLEDIARALQSGRREDAGVTAKAKGLRLVRVFYRQDELDKALTDLDNTCARRRDGVGGHLYGETGGDPREVVRGGRGGADLGAPRGPGGQGPAG